MPANCNQMKARLLSILTALALLAPLAAPPSQAEPWPYQPFHEEHGLGNHYGTYQDYGGGPYYHDGIDLVTSAPVETYSVSDGTLTHITYNQPYYSGIMIGEPISGGEGWLYWHINASTFQFDIGDPVQAYDYIGTTAYWSSYQFHHVHMNVVRGTGGYPWSWYVSIDNPLVYMDPHGDPVPPVFIDARPDERFAFTRNLASTVLDADALDGDVDIVARIADDVGLPDWMLNPFSIDYWIEGAEESVPLTNTVTFIGQIPSDGTVGVIYHTQYPMQSQGNYTGRVYYFNVTNTDGDGFVESADASYSWQTGNFSPGDYWVYVKAFDVGGNAVTDSMRCTVAGVVEPVVELPETSHDFGVVGSGLTETWEMVIENQGTDPLSVREIVSSHPAFTMDRSHFYVMPGEEEIVAVTFAPSLFGHYLAAITIQTNDPVTPAVVVSVRGLGADPSDVEPAAGSDETHALPIEVVSTRSVPGKGIAVTYALNQGAEITYEVFDLTGRQVDSGDLGFQGPGSAEFVWQRPMGGAGQANSGIYLIRLTDGMHLTTSRGLLLR